MTDINKICKENAVIFWNDCVGDIYLPDDNADMPPRTVNELPSDLRSIYEKFQTDIGCSIRYVVTFNGKPGLLLTGFYSTDFVSQITNVPIESEKMASLLNRVYGYLYERGRCLEKKINDPDCMTLIGYGLPPESHELSLFIPGTKDDDTINKYIDIFEDMVFGDDDRKFLQAIANY